jgi:hypothetical protein
VFSLTTLQRRVVAALWEAMENGTPAVHQATLLETAEARSAKLSHFFRGSPAWGTLVVPGYKCGVPFGTYQLAPPSTAKLAG